MIAEPEKALLDFWYLEKGTWNEARMMEMRFQNGDTIDTGKLRSYAERVQPRRLGKIVNLWCARARSHDEGTVQL